MSTDYTQMAAHYDAIMERSGYYDYDKIAAHLAAVPARHVLEAGCGTGLVLQSLLKRKAYAQVTGIDMTPDMLAQALIRLEPWPEAELFCGDVAALDLPERYDLIFSQGGPWYWVHDEGVWTLVSHLASAEGDAAGLAAVARHLTPGGRFLLGVQGPHESYTVSLGDGTVYAQQVEPLDGGRFAKTYRRLRDGADLFPPMTLTYQTYPVGEAHRMLAAAGLTAARNIHGTEFTEMTGGWA